MPLTPRQIAALVEQCIESAHDLYVSGVILHREGVPTTARALLILATEEYGKIGWLYRALMLPKDAFDDWKQWSRGFTLHVTKNAVGRLMRMSDALLPTLARHFRDSFPFFSISPQQLERQKQAVLYVDFDHDTGEALTPRTSLERYGLDNRPLIEEVEKIIRYVALNKQAHVFDSDVMAAYQHLNEIAKDEETDRARLLHLFYALVLERSTGLISEQPFDQIAHDVAETYPDVATELLSSWAEIGRRLRESSGVAETDSN
jgi:AbiV family abortive infection protein